MCKLKPMFLSTQHALVSTALWAFRCFFHPGLVEQAVSAPLGSPAPVPAAPGVSQMEFHLTPLPLTFRPISRWGLIFAALQLESKQ